MSNKTDLQALNSQYSALIELLRSKASGGSADTISFTVEYGDEVLTFNAESGMTWQQFIDSSYNNYSVECFECGGSSKLFTDLDGYYVTCPTARQTSEDSDPVESMCPACYGGYDAPWHLYTSGDEYVELASTIEDGGAYRIGFFQG